MSSYNSVRLVDVKGRPDRSAASQPESDSARFPDPLADQQKAGRPEQAEEPSQRGSDSVGETNPNPDSTTQQRKDQEKAKAEPEGTEGKTIEVDSREDESREVNLSDGQAEVDPETVPSGSFGGDAAGVATEDQPIAPALPALAELPQVAADSSTGLQNQTITPGQMAQVATEASAPAAGLAPQVATPKAPAGGNASAGDAADVNPLLVDDAPVTTQGFAGSEQSGGFSQTEGEAVLPDPLTQVQAAATPSIDAAIQDARIEAIAMDSRPVAQAQPIQLATPTATVLGGQAAQPTEAILNQIQARIQPAMNKAILRLSPESLGRVAIEVTVDGGEVRAEMRVESADSLQAIQKYIPELKAMFAQADMELSELNLQLDSDGSGFDWEEETPDEKQAWFGSKANQNIESEAPGGANSPRLSSLEGGLDLIA